MRNYTAQKLFIYLTIILLNSANHVNAQTSRLETVIQKGHEAVVKAVAYTPDGKYLLTGSRDKSIKLWETSSAREVKSYKGHISTINDLAVSKDGKFFASSSADNTAKVWEIKTGKLLFTTPEDRDYMTDVTFSPDGKYLIAGGFDPFLKVWDYRTKKLIKKLAVDPDRGMGLGLNFVFSPDGKYLATGEDGKNLKIYHTNSWDTLYTIPLEKGWCGGCATFVAFSPDSKKIAKMANGGAIEVFDVKGKRKIGVLLDEVKDARSITFDHKGEVLMVATENTIYQWAMKTGELILKFNLDVIGVNDAAYSPNSEEIIVGGNDNKASAWSARDGSFIKEYSGILQEVDKGGINYDPNNFRESHLAKYLELKSKILLSKDGKKLIRGKFGKLAKMWDIKSGKTLTEFRGHKKAILCADLSDDGKRLITGDGDGILILWDVETGQKLKVFDKHETPVLDVKFNHKNDQIVSVGWEGFALIWDLESGELVSNLYFENRAAFSVAFSSNDLYIIAGLLDKKMEMWEIDSKQLVREFVGHTGVVSEIKPHPVKQEILTIGWDGSVRLWDVNTGLMSKKFKSNRPLYTGTYAIERNEILVAGANQEILILNAENLEFKKTLKGHQSDIVTVIVNESEGLLVSNSLDGVTKIWDLEKGKEFFEHIHIGKNDWMVKSTQGYFNATDGARRAIHFVKGLETYSVDQFFNDFYRPDLIPDLFSTKGVSSERRGILQQIDKFPPPSIKLALKEKLNSEQVEVFVKSVDEGGGLKELKLFHNGKRIAFKKPKPKTNKKGKKEWVSKITLPLVGGKNIFSLVGVSDGGTESQLIQKEYFSAQSDPASNCYIVAVGINDYKNDNLDLNYAKADASAFVATMKETQHQLFKNIKVTSLYDREATKENILTAIDQIIAEIGLNDVFIFYYAGHGSVVDNRFFFIPTETNRLFDIKNLEKSALETSVLQATFEKIKALKQVIIMDACHSGKSVELLAQRGSVEEKAIAQLSRSAGIHVLASAGSDQYASEFKQLEHGVFTFALLKALKGEADGSPKEGKITLFELKSYLDDQVPEMSMEYKGKPQYPYTFSKGNDFPLKVISLEKD